MNKKSFAILGIILVLILSLIIYYIITNRTNSVNKTMLIYSPTNMQLLVNNFYVKNINKSGESWYAGQNSNGLGVTISSISKDIYENLRNEESIKINDIDQINISLDTDYYSLNEYNLKNAILDIYTESKVHDARITQIFNNSILLDFKNFESSTYYCSLRVEFENRGTVNYDFKIEIQE